MAFLSKTTKKDDNAKVKTVVADTVVSIKTGNIEDLSWVLHSPRLSEKAANLGSEAVYVFNIDPRANKILVKKAVKRIYSVTPIKVNISKIARKAVFIRGKKGVKGGGKKAMVFLKKGDKIDF